VNGGERLLSFTSQFSTDVDLATVEGATGTAAILGTGSTITDRLKSAGVSRRNVDIRAAIAWLRQYMYPSYATGQGNGIPAEGATITIAPKKLRLVLPGSGIGTAGGSTVTPDSVRVIMTQCDVTYDAFFPSGLPRVVTVSLAFAELPQFGGYIQFPSRDDMESAVAGDPQLGSRFSFGYHVRPKDR
jgi:hypothetical protein